MATHTSLSDEIRAAVDSSGLTRYRIAKDLGIAESTMSRFMGGKGGLSMDYLDRLGGLLELHITVEPKSTREGD